MGGIVIEFNTLTRSSSIVPKWTTVDCLNCNTGHVYSVENNNGNKTDRVIIHENTVYGQAFEDLKQQSNYSKTFNILLDNKKENLIPMPGPEEDVSELLASTQKKMQSILDQYLEQLRIESKVRMERFKKQEEQHTQDAMAQIKLENTQLWSKLVQVTNNSGKEKEETTVPTPQAPSLPQQPKKTDEEEHPRLANSTNTQNSSPLPPMKRLSFFLDEAAIRNLRNKDLDHKDLKQLMEQQQSNHQDGAENGEEDEENMFNLDEEFSDEEKASETNEATLDDKLDDNQHIDQEQVQGSSKEIPLSTSLKKSVSNIDDQMAWIKKKRNTRKYLAQDFDIKSEFKRTFANNNNEGDMNISKLATSMPITIHYPSEKNDNTTESSEEKNKKRDILASSFANYDSSFSDRTLSNQFPRVAPPPNGRKGQASSALIKPQLESLIGKSLDTRGISNNKSNKGESKYNSDDEEFDATLPPHVWAASHDLSNE
ncbi:hypothetical protein [Parasitella parasitica]|uniref:Uncharacterized protein n=1 Tax=Parasitella parasitica TaxID=35722 RepID=A0A0B7NJK5_9FUNG|nr:hypothetical protein [Parasitella parasitica]